jgi:ABC-type bacteriocin/lantibiotic exporter with double-glycine peptidase domain
MVLEYLSLSLPYARLLDILEIKPYGAPRRNILALNRHGVDVTYREATLDLLREYLDNALPVIVFVYTGELTYWQGREPTNHAVIVVGMDDEGLFVNDPEFQNAPQYVSREEFELGWQESDNACAILSLPGAETTQ